MDIVVGGNDTAKIPSTVFECSIDRVLV